MNKCGKCNREYEGTRCKPCAALYMKEWNARNPEKVKLSKSKSYKKNKVKIDKKNNEWAKKNRERSNEIKGEWKNKNKEKYLDSERNRANERYQERIDEYREKESTDKRREQKRNWRLKNKELLSEKNKKYYQESKFKCKARRLLNDAVRSGKILKPELCVKCSLMEKIEGHHEDYDKPLEVIWLCERCHKELHRKY